MQFLGTLQQTEPHAKLPVQRVCIVPDNFEATAFHGILRSKRTDDHMPSAPNRTYNLANVSRTVARRGKEMKDSTVVPHIVNGGLKFYLTDICYKPMHSIGNRAQSFAICVNGCLAIYRERFP